MGEERGRLGICQDSGGSKREDGGRMGETRTLRVAPLAPYFVGRKSGPPGQVTEEPVDAAGRAAVMTELDAITKLDAIDSSLK